MPDSGAAAKSAAQHASIDPAIISPIGYPEEFPKGLAPALQRNFRSWRTLVHDDTYGSTRE